MRQCSNCGQTFEVTPQTWYFRKGKPEGTRCRACLFEYYKLKGQEQVIDPITGETVSRSALRHRELRRTEAGRQQCNAYAASYYEKQKADRAPKFIDLVRQAVQGPIPLQEGATHLCGCCGHNKVLSEFNKSLTGSCRGCQHAYRTFNPPKRHTKLDVGQQAVYKLYWPGEPEFYIGRSTDPYARRYAHKNVPSSLVMREAIARLGLPSMEILEIVEGEKTAWGYVKAKEREKYWITTLDATNRATGGLNTQK